MKEFVGVLVRDLPRYVLALAGGKSRYLTLTNRRERLEAAPYGEGYRCKWQWTSDLHAPTVMPFLGRWLMKRALSDHPIRRRPNPDSISDNPEASFVVGHRGMTRLSQLLATLESIAGQSGAHCECIVVEQDVEPHLAGRLPSWVRHVHSPPPSRDMPYCRSWAFNVGAGHARGKVLVLHDSDLLVPADYVARSLECIGRGFDVVNVKRFIFYLDEAHSRAVCGDSAALFDATPETILQNPQGGGSAVITREAYDRIGGMDEAFIGWGGEDNEFWERAMTLAVWPWGNLPLVHLWHAAQPGKCDTHYHTALRYRSLTQVNPAERIRRLAALPRGMISRPTGWEIVAAPPDDAADVATRSG